jgi:hypothetical protein
LLRQVRSDKAREYLNSLQFKPPRDMRSLFPQCDPLALDLLGRMLTFDPDKRISGAPPHHPAPLRRSALGSSHLHTRRYEY